MPPTQAGRPSLNPFLFYLKHAALIGPYRSRVSLRVKMPSAVSSRYK